jgi:hypothetical protein
MKRQKRSKSAVLYDNQTPFEPRTLSRSITSIVQDSPPSTTTIYEDEVSRSSTSQDAHANDPDGALVDFIHNVRQPMKALAFTCKRTIINLQSRFTNDNHQNGPSFARMRENLEKAITLFESSQKEAIFRMYQQRALRHDAAEQQATDNSDHISVLEQGEDVFLVYFFVFCLVEFARELAALVGLVEKLFTPAAAIRSSFSQWLSNIKATFKGKSIFYVHPGPELYAKLQQ